jgi:hypothetical protein
MRRNLSLSKMKNANILQNIKMKQKIKSVRKKRVKLVLNNNQYFGKVVNILIKNVNKWTGRAWHQRRKHMIM